MKETKISFNIWDYIEIEDIDEILTEQTDEEAINKTEYTCLYIKPNGEVLVKAKYNILY